MLANNWCHCSWNESTKQRRVSVCRAAAVCLALINAGDAPAYVAHNPWSVTASGSPTRLTWGIAKENTFIPGHGHSDLISFFDGLFSVTNLSGDLTQRPWFWLFQESTGRWEELSGLTFTYEPADDGSNLKDSPGVLGVRADIRVAGSYFDGPSGVLAYSWMPNTGDIVIDTGDFVYYSNSWNNYRRARNTLTHEIGHALGLMHIVSSDAALLMEPQLSMSIDGPQLDDIRGIHAFYGDVNEKSFNGLGNGTPSRATDLGSLALGSSLSVGSDAVGDQVVLPTETDFVSIHNSADIDYYSFTISTPGLLNVSLTPWGGIFNQMDATGSHLPFDANSRNDLSLAVFGPNGTTLLGSANQAGAGETEVLAGLPLSSAGKYYVRVMGAGDEIQLYELGLTLSPTGGTLAGDFNGDGVVNGKDFLLWQQSVGLTGPGLLADANGDGIVNTVDLAIWRSQYGQTSALTASLGVPEPCTSVLLAMLLLAGCCMRKSDHR